MESDNTFAKEQTRLFSSNTQATSVGSGMASELTEAVSSEQTEIVVSESEPMSLNEGDKNKVFVKPAEVEPFDEKQDESKKLCLSLVYKTNLFV